MSLRAGGASTLRWLWACSGHSRYDAAGNLIAMDVARTGPCTVSGGCALQHYTYQWDEVGRLIRAARDGNALEFTYDASDQRVRKSSGSAHTMYVFASLELRRAAHDGTNYEVGDVTEVPYLFANGVRLARVVSQDSTTHVFLELGDHLGSTSVVLDLGPGELVQRSTAYAYGEVESSFRPDKWDSFREDYRFTGKEDDVEVGLIYFGKRYYAPLLGRWISADPLAVHAPGKADLNLYAYVHGKVLVAVDPVGLCDPETETCGERYTYTSESGEADDYYSDPTDTTALDRADTESESSGPAATDDPEDARRGLEREYEAAYESGRLTARGSRDSEPIGVALNFEAEAGIWNPASGPLHPSVNRYSDQWYGPVVGLVETLLGGSWIHVEAGGMLTSDGELKVYVGHSSRPDPSDPNDREVLVAGANADLGLGAHYVIKPSDFGIGSPIRCGLR